MFISFVIPCYRSERTLGDVVNKLRATIRQEDDYEIICVNDCSPDNTISLLSQLARQDHKLKVIDLAVNTGQHNATMAGLNYVQGDVVVVLEDDGQSPAEGFYELVERLDDDHDVVYAAFGKKKQAAGRNIGSMLAVFMGRVTMGAPSGVEGSSFFAVKRFIVDEIVRYKHPYTFLHGLILRTTKKIGDCPMEHRARIVGASGYTFSKLVSLWLNGFTSFSVKPLRITTMLGMFFAIIGFIAGIIIIMRKLIVPSIPAGYTSLMAVLLFVGGMIMMSMGMLGEYIGRMYICMNNAPQYVVRSTINISEQEAIDE